MFFQTSAERVSAACFFVVIVELLLALGNALAPRSPDVKYYKSPAQSIINYINFITHIIQGTRVINHFSKLYFVVFKVLYTQICTFLAKI